MVQSMKKKAYQTGFCSIGHHEGTRPVAPSGNGNKVCIYPDICGCACHKEIDEIFALTGMPRVVQQNPLYRRHKAHLSMPDVEVSDPPVLVRRPLEPIELPPGMVGPDALKSPVEPNLPPSVTRSFAPTPTGRAARGELEQWVLNVCTVWAVETRIDPTWKQLCTPPWIAREIGRTEGLNEPSTGAITAVLDRWVLYGFAVTAKKPFRFTGFTEEAGKSTLEKMKKNYKDKKRMPHQSERLLKK